MTILLVLAILVFLIVVHELGHFVTAKIFRVKVEEFGVGYPPRAFFLGRIGDTDYTVNWIPFGGFVRLFGEHDTTLRAKGSLAAAPRLAQAAILIAGVFMNALTAWVLFAGALYVGIPHAVGAVQEGTQAELIISEVVPGSPAASAGLIPGDEVISIRDQDTGDNAKLTPEDIVRFVRSRGGQAIDVVVMRSGKEFDATIRPAHAVITDAANRPALGVGLVIVASESLPPWQAVKTALPVTINKFKVVLTGLGTLFVGALRGAPALEDVAGPVGLVSVVGDAAKQGFGDVLALAGFISVNLAIVNLLPIPALDGGRLVLIGVEALMRRAASRIAVRVLNVVGVGLIIALMITVTYHDIALLLT